MKSSQRGGIQYQDVDDTYLQARQLQKRAGWVLLWALGVGAVISGDYFGWNLGLAVGGFGGLAIATLLMAVMYICMVFSIAELSAAMPHAGGFYSFVRNAMGPTAGYLCGVTDAVEYVITPAVIVVGIGGYMNSLVFGGTEQAPTWAPFVWWGLSYGFFVLINIRGVELTLKVGLVITALAMAVLVVTGVMLSMNNGEFKMKPETMSFIGIGMAVVMTVNHMVIPRLIAASALRKITGDAIRDASIEEKFALVSPIFRQQHIVACAILEGAAIINLVLYMLTSFVGNVAAAAVLLMLLMLRFPTANRIEHWTQHKIEELSIT